MIAVPGKKLFAVFLFLTITLTAAPFVLRAEAPEPGADASLALSNLAVPEEIGKVQERFTGNSTRTIIQIQDVHAHALAQQNIAAILERLRVVFGIEKIALEGAWAYTSLPRSHAIPTSREKQLLATTLLDHDRISGPVYAAIMSPEPITLIGIEDEEFYEKNRALFLARLEKSKKIDEKLQIYDTSLQELQRSTWGPALLAFGNAFGKFRETSDLGKFFPVLLENAEAQGVDASDLAQIILVRDIMALEKLFRKDQLEQEVKHLMQEYKNTPWTLEELIRGGKIPAEKLGFYPELKKLTRLYQLRDRISLGDLTTQLEILTGRILGKLVRTPKEDALWKKNERFYLARRILLLQASPADIKAYENEKFPLESELAGASLSEALSISLAFYKTVKKRDEIFFNKIMNDPSLAGNVAIITGGFHTDGLSQRFRDAGISYITITPELGGAPMNEKLYNERMTEKRGTLQGPDKKGQAGNGKQITNTLPKDHSSASAAIDGQTLSELRNAIATVDKNFPEAFEVLKMDKDVRRAEMRFTGQPVSISTPNKIAHLRASGRVINKKTDGASIPVLKLNEKEFMAKPRSEQREQVRAWFDQANASHEKAILVSSVSILQKIFATNARSETRVGEIIKSGDMLVLFQDVPAKEIRETLLAPRGIERLEAGNFDSFLQMSRLQNLAKKSPFAIVKEGYGLPEKPVSLRLYRVIALHPELREAFKNPAFFFLLQDLATEILSQELPKTSV